LIGVTSPMAARSRGGGFHVPRVTEQEYKLSELSHSRYRDWRAGGMD
jgi:hypothetical protein